MAFPVVQVRRPAVLSGQLNGKLDPKILVTVPGQAGGLDLLLVSPAARAWKALAAAALKAGHVLKPSGAWCSYRPYDEQVRIFLQRYQTTPIRMGDGKYHTRTWNGRTYYQKPGTAAAAVPGTSNHGWAITVDAGEERDSDAAAEPLDNATLAWLLANEQRFGWSHEIQTEPWHIRYWSGDQIPKAVLDYERSLHPTPAPAPSEEDEDDMAAAYIYFKDTRAKSATVTPVPGAHLYRVEAGIGVHQTQDAFAVAQYLSGLAGKKLTVIGSPTKPARTTELVDATGKVTDSAAWWEGIHVMNGPLKGIRL